jgi:hypothetical protein
MRTKIDGLYLVNYFIRALTFEWYVVWCGSKNGYYKLILPPFQNESYVLENMWV